MPFSSIAEGITENLHDGSASNLESVQCERTMEEHNVHRRAPPYTVEAQLAIRRKVKTEHLRIF